MALWYGHCSYLIVGSLHEASWVRLSQHGKGFILRNIDRGRMPLISTTFNARTAWAIVKEEFNRKTPTSLHTLLNTIGRRRCSNKREIATIIEKYDELWQRHLEPTSEATSQSIEYHTKSKNALEVVLLLLASSKVATEALILTSLFALDHIVGIPTMEALATNSKVCTWLLEMYSFSISTPGSSKYFTSAFDEYTHAVCNRLSGRWRESVG